LVERLRLRTGELHLTHGPDPEARRLGCRQDVAGVASRHGVGLDHRESETSCHWSSCRRSVVGWSRGDVTWMIDGRKPLYPLIISHPPKVLLELALENLHHVHRAAHDAHSGGLEGLELLLGSATRARDDRPGVTHPAALGGSLASHEAGHRLADVLADV